MNYEEMNKMQINKHVARALNLEWNAIASDGLIIDGKSLSVDYCNNPSDAWPIIVDNEIDIYFNSSSGHGAYKHISNQRGIDVANKNPLRAAMICFLKMKDAENGC